MCWGGTASASASRTEKAEHYQQRHRGATARLRQVSGRRSLTQSTDVAATMPERDETFK